MRGDGEREREREREREKERKRESDVTLISHAQPTPPSGPPSATAGF